MFGIFRRRLFEVVRYVSKYDAVLQIFVWKRFQIFFAINTRNNLLNAFHFGIFVVLHLFYIKRW